MRLGLFQMGQETNTFNPTSTTIDDFRRFGLYQGPELLERMRGNGTVGGFLEVVEAAGPDIETVPMSRIWGGADARLSREALAFCVARLRQDLAAAGSLDGLAMQLHGAASADGLDDVEGELLAIARDALGPAVPIVLTLDHHANITERMVRNVDALVGFRTQPHDPYETGVASTELLLRIVRGEVRPVTAWRKLRLLSHQEQYLTSGGPMKIWFDRARQLEQDPRVLTVSNFPMQPWLDVEEGGWATVVVTDGDAGLASRLADELADLAWSLRADFQVRSSLSPDDAVRSADAGPGLVILSDTGDSVFGGGAGDSTVLLESMLRVGVTGRGLLPLVDPVAVSRLTAAGIGASVTLELGAGVAGVNGFFRPVTVTGTVRRIGPGRLVITEVPWPESDMGTTVVFDVGSVTVLVSQEAGLGGNHPDVYRSFGIEPADHRMVVLKTASNFQWYTPFASRVVRADTSGPTQSDVVGLPWSRVPRPIYPLDDPATWRG